MANDPITSVPQRSSEWRNWSRNLVHQPVNGEAYYYLPRNMAELKTVLEVAAANGKVVRVSGQRHSQTPLVVDDNRGVSVASAKNWLVDLDSRPTWARVGTNALCRDRTYGHGGYRRAGG